jgi:hypothetical protein
LIRSSTRARRTAERGFALILALVLSILYFGFIELLMMDASRELSEARRFRARIIALTLAENGVELGAAQMLVEDGEGLPPVTDEQGTAAFTEREVDGMTGQFRLVGEGRSKGPESTSASVIVEGTIDGNRPVIYFSRHTK